MNKPRSRKEKLKLLSEIKTGKISLNELKPTVYEIWVQDRNDQLYYHCENQNIRCKYFEIESYNSKTNNQMNILINYIEALLPTKAIR